MNKRQRKREKKNKKNIENNLDENSKNTINSTNIDEEESNSYNKNYYSDLKWKKNKKIKFVSFPDKYIEYINVQSYKYFNLSNTFPITDKKYEKKSKNKKSQKRKK